MTKLAIFDVDFTLTKKETLIQFYLFMLKNNIKYIIYLPKVLIAGLFYGLKLFSAKQSKQVFISFLKGVSEEDLSEISSDFYESKLSKIIYNEAHETIKKRKAEGCKIYLISASPEFYLNELYEIKEIDRIIGTKLEIIDGVYTGKFFGDNCKGEEKVKRLYEVISKEGLEVDYENSYMYSDSLSDLPLFKIVGNPFLINYKKRSKNISILKWK
ncbi:MAG: HAD-IB family hydrolase [Clostridiaceae bacterium]